MYYIWICNRQGWLTPMGTTDTRLSIEYLFSHEEALRICKKHITHDGGLNAIPVDPTILAEVSKEAKKQ